MSRLPGPRTPFGHLIEGIRVARDPYGGMLDLYRRYGPVVAVGYRPLRFVYLLGREANEFVLASHHGFFEWREALKALIPVLGDTALVVTDGDEHDRRRRLVQPAFGLKRIDSYQPVIAEEAKACTERVLEAGETDLYVQFKATIQRIAIRSLFGDTLGHRATEIGEALQVAIDYANLPPYLNFNHDLPFTPFRKAMRATRVVDDIVYAEINRRRDTNDVGKDLLGSLLTASEDGQGLSDLEIRDQVVSLIAGGYETTTALTAWIAYALLTHPEVNATLRRELDSTDRTRDTSIKDLLFLDAVVNETLRLHGPTPFSARYAPNSFEFAGHHVTARTTVVYASYVTHHDENHWKDPEAFRPERWLDDVQPDPYVFVPFGGGYRKCIGFAMATLEAKTIIADLFGAARMTLTSDNVRARGVATMRPAPGILVTATPRQV